MKFRIKRKINNNWKPKEFKRVCDNCGYSIMDGGSSCGVDSNGSMYGKHQCDDGSLGVFR